MVTLATSARLTSKDNQPDLFEPSTKTGQNQYTQKRSSPRLAKRAVIDPMETWREYVRREHKGVVSAGDLRPHGLAEQVHTVRLAARIRAFS